MATINCKRNKGYQWIEEQGYHFKGYLQASDGSVLRGKEAVAFLSDIKTYEEFRYALKSYYGLFSIIIEKKDEVWIGVDIARSMPIYYSIDLQYISDDVDIILQERKDKEVCLDDIHMLEMYTTSFVGFQNTVYSHIRQLEIGCTARVFSGSIEQKPYYIHGDTKKTVDGEIKKRLSDSTDHMISRLLSVIDGRQIVISLSGGYDSRYLACSLKKNGVDNVICYTYGRADSFEVIQSKKVAEALGYEWHNIVYDDESVRRILKDDGQYIDYANRPDYIVYLQNYLAVKSLHERRLIPENAVFITGLCNDMPTGYYIPDEEIARKYGYSNKGVAEYSYEQRFIKFNLSEQVSMILKKDIIDYLERMSIKVKDYKSFIGALDCIETAGFHSHCYLNMNVVHEFFGYEWLLPCWDRELLDFWYTLPSEKRIGQKTYEEYIVNDLGVLYGVGTKKHINVSASTPFKQKIKRKIGSVVVRIAYPLGIPMRRNTDINNMSILEVELYKQIKQKRSIKPERAALILLLSIYIMERRYGNKWYSRIKEYLA